MTLIFRRIGYALEAAVLIVFLMGMTYYLEEKNGSGDLYNVVTNIFVR